MARELAPSFEKVCRSRDKAFHAAHELAQRLLEEGELLHLQCCGNCENAFACEDGFDAVEDSGPVGAGYWCPEWERRNHMNKKWDDHKKGNEDEND